MPATKRLLVDANIVYQESGMDISGLYYGAI
jgi:hypothetical protein